MMKKIIALLMAAMMIVGLMATATAESSARQALLDILNKQRGGATETPVEPPVEEPVEDPVIGYGTEVKIEDPFYKVTRYATYNGMSGSNHKANVLVELQNTSNATLYPSSGTLKGFDADGNTLFEETYISMYTDVVEPGEYLYINEWLYNYIDDPSKISYFVITIDTRTSSYYDYIMLESEAWIEGGDVFAEVPNPTDAPMFDVDVTFVVSNADGVLLDIGSVSSGSYVGVSAGASFFMASDVEDLANGGYFDTLDGTVVSFAQIEN